MKSHIQKTHKSEIADVANYKGIYYNDDSGTKYTDPVSGAHFEFSDMCARLLKIKQLREPPTPVASIQLVNGSRNINSKISMSTIGNINTKPAIKALEANLKFLCNDKKPVAHAKGCSNRSTIGMALNSQYCTKSVNIKPQMSKNKENTITFDKKMQEQM
jgi:hypothetical protein